MKTTFGLPKRREEVINMLQEAYADRNLEDDDYEQRLHTAMNAQSVEELQEVIHDFPNVTPLKKEKRPRSSPDSSYKTPAHYLELLRSKAKNFPAIFTSQNLKIDSSISYPMKITTVFGNQKVDFSHAVVEGDQLVLQVESVLGETVIDLRGEGFRDKNIYLLLHNLLGEVRIILPKGVRIDNQLAPILGEIQHGKRSMSNIFARLSGRAPKVTVNIPFNITLRGNCVLGTVRIVHD